MPSPVSARYRTGMPHAGDEGPVVMMTPPPAHHSATMSSGHNDSFDDTDAEISKILNEASTTHHAMVFQGASPSPVPGMNQSPLHPVNLHIWRPQNQDNRLTTQSPLVKNKLENMFGDGSGELLIVDWQASERFFYSTHQKKAKLEQHWSSDPRQSPISNISSLLSQHGLAAAATAGLDVAAECFVPRVSGMGAPEKRLPPGHIPPSNGSNWAGPHLHNMQQQQKQLMMLKQNLSQDKPLANSTNHTISHSSQYQHIRTSYHVPGGGTGCPSPNTLANARRPPLPRQPIHAGSNSIHTSSGISGQPYDGIAIPPELGPVPPVVSSSLGLPFEAVEPPEGAVVSWLTVSDDLGSVMAKLALEGNPAEMRIKPGGGAGTSLLCASRAMGDTGAPVTWSSGGGSGKHLTGSSMAVHAAGPATTSLRKRIEPVESSVDKSKFKEFFKQLKVKEKESYQAASDYAHLCLQTYPKTLHWRICLELADLAKRQDMLLEARALFNRVHELEPRAHQGWLEHAKMEEEFGKLAECEQILLQGLKACSDNENLLLKSVKLEEKLGKIPQARVLLSRMRHLSLEKAWKVILEGALLEARAGNLKVARKVFSYLLQSVPWYGPIYHEAYKMEERAEELDRASRIIEVGLQEIPRYGPLWFNAIRLCDKMASSAEESAVRVREVVQRALVHISRELVWKLFFEAAQVEDRCNNLDLCRAAYAQSAAYCPDNLRWKVWVGGARTELRAGNIDAARHLLERAQSEVPAKVRSMVLLELARLEEFTGRISEARGILERARRETRHEWKVFLESVLLELRNDNIPLGIERAREALRIHTGTGRLWAVLIQMVSSDEEKLHVFMQALKEVPKSGEVWCEGARMAMNPLSPLFDLETARTRLGFAICFTPQYGDSFIELLRLELLQKSPDSELLALEQECVNADPNYGALWFYAKRHPMDGTRHILANARSHLQRDLYRHRKVYQRALLRCQSSAVDERVADVGLGSAAWILLEEDGSQEGSVHSDTTMTTRSRSSSADSTSFQSSSSSTLPLNWPSSNMTAGFERNILFSDFSLGISELQHVVQHSRDLSSEMRLRLIFGPDPVQP